MGMNPSPASRLGEPDVDGDGSRSGLRCWGHQRLYVRTTEEASLDPRNLDRLDHALARPAVHGRGFDAEVGRYVFGGEEIVHGSQTTTFVVSLSIAYLDSLIVTLGTFMLRCVSNPETRGASTWPQSNQSR